MGTKGGMERTLIEHVSANKNCILCEALHVPYFISVTTPPLKEDSLILTSEKIKPTQRHEVLAQCLKPSLAYSKDYQHPSHQASL